MTLPPPAPLHDPRAPRRAAVLRQLDVLAHVLDTSIRVPGTRARFGMDAVIGLIPGIGDATGAVLSSYIVVQAARLGAPVPSLLRMLLNVGVEALLGTVPLAGDLFDAAYKANARNVAILRREIDRPGSTRGSSRAVLAGVVLGLVAILGAAALATWWVLRELWMLLA